MHHDYEVDIDANYDGTYSVICYECGTEFEATRFDAAFCGSTCRSRNHRKSKQLDKIIDKAKTLVNDLIARMPKHGESKSYSALMAIRNRIDSALSVVESESLD